MVTKKRQGVSSNLFVLGFKFSDSVPTTFGTRRNFPNFLVLDFQQLLDGLGKKLKFHIHVQQGLKTFLNGLLDSSFYWVTATSIFRSASTSLLSWL